MRSTLLAGLVRTSLLLALLAAAADCAEDPDIAQTSRGLTGFLTADIPVSTTTALTQDRPAAAVDAGGVTLVVFRDASSGDGGDIRGRFVSSGGVPLGSDFLINTVTTAAQTRPDVAVAGSEFMVVWQDASQTAPDTSGTAVRARLLVHGGSGNPVFIEPADFVVPFKVATGQTYPAVDGAADGGFVVVWQDLVHTVDPSAAGIRSRRIAGNGVPFGVNHQVNSTTAGAQSQPDVATASDGSYVVVFTDASGSGDPSSTGIRARAFGADDVPLAPDALVNATTTGAQNDPAVAPGPAGDLLVAWTDASGVGDAVPSAIRARRLVGGAPSGPELLVNSTTAASQTKPAVAADGNDGSFIIAWADASKTAPDTSASAVRARRLLPDDSFAELDQVIETTTDAAQSQPALPMRALTSLVFAWTSPDDSSLGIRGRAMLLSCPQPTGNFFFADPLADRGPSGLPAPTGARSPGVCAFPRLTDALAAASAVAATPGVSGQAVASRDSAAPGQEVTFAGEEFPWVVPARVRITTTDDALLGGAGFDPSRVPVTVNNNSAGGGVASVRLLGAPTRSEAGGAIAGMMFQESCDSCPTTAIRIDGLANESQPRLEWVVVDGAGAATWDTGVEVRGDAWLETLWAQDFASDALARTGLHVVNDGGTQLGDRVVISNCYFPRNNLGIDVSGGSVNFTGASSGVQFSTKTADGGSGTGILVRDWRLNAQGDRVVVPTTFSAVGSSAGFNEGSGFVVDLSDPASTARLDGAASSFNQEDGVRVTGAPHSDAALDQLAVPVTEYGLVVLSSRMEQNLGDGIRLGSVVQGAQIVAKIGDFSQRNFIQENGGVGLRLLQSAPIGSCPATGPSTCTGVTIVNDQFNNNAGPGIFLARGILVPLYLPSNPGWRRGFLFNTIGHNGFLAAGCTSTENWPQIFVTGPVGLPAGVCPSQNSQASCEAMSGAADNNHCVWNGTGCHVAWDLRADDTSCAPGYRNNMYDYNTTDASAATTGIYANNSSFVMADGNGWASSAMPNQHIAFAAGSFIDANLICVNIVGCTN